MLVKRFSFIMFFLAWLSTGTSGLSRDIAVMYALEDDFKTLKQFAEFEPTTVKIGHQKVAKFNIGADTVYASKMGSGPIQSAVSTEAVLARFNPDILFSVGVAGALTTNHPPRTWVEVNSFVAYQKGSHGETGFQLSPKAGGAWKPASQSDFILGEVWSNAPLVKAASGEIFVSSEDFRSELASEYECNVVEMNLFGVTAAAQNHGIKHYHFRLISDNADATASEDFMSFVKRYDGSGGNMLAEVLKNLPPDKTDPSSHGNIDQLFKNIEKDLDLPDLELFSPTNQWDRKKKKP